MEIEGANHRSLFISSRKLRALIYAEDALNDELGKTAHGIIRFSARYHVSGLIDSTYLSRMGKSFAGVPVYASTQEAVKAHPRSEVFVVGIAPSDLGSLEFVIDAAKFALSAGLSVHNGLHAFLSELPSLVALAANRGVSIVDVRKPPQRRLRMYTGDITDLRAPRIVITGQDAAIGKRTAALNIANALSGRLRCCLIGTGQTAWFQGFRYGIRLDSLPMDFAAGELEGEILRASVKEKPAVIIIEGQGSLLNPAYAPEMCVLLTSTRPAALIYVVAPGRTQYADFPRFRLPHPEAEIALMEQLSGAKVVGIVVNDRLGGELPAALEDYSAVVGPDAEANILVEALLEELRHQ